MLGYITPPNMKINSQRTKDIIIRSKIMKHLEVKIRENVFSIGLDNNLDMIPKVHATKTNLRNYIKLKTFCMAKKKNKTVVGPAWWPSG